MSVRDLIVEDLRAAEAPLHIGGALRAWLFSPQIRAVWLCRLTIYFKNKGVIGRLCSKHFALSLVRRFGLYVGATAKLGRGLSLPHPVGIVIGLGVVVGNSVTIYQGVTLGLKSKRGRTYPIIGDHVIIYAGAVVAGGVVVGSGCIIGANAVVLSDVPNGAVVPAGFVYQ